MKPFPAALEPVLECGQGATEALGRFVALKPTLRAQAQRVVEAGDIALYMGRWTLQGTDPAGQPVSMGGESTDVLRRQPDGRWLIALDNPWGGRILEQH